MCNKVVIYLTFTFDWKINKKRRVSVVHDKEAEAVSALLSHPLLSGM